MQGTFGKSMLRVGKYHSPDGIVTVTPRRLKNWANNFARMTQARQVVPMHWDHGSDYESLSPISQDDYEQQNSRSARNSVGRLLNFKVAPDGQSAEVVFDTRTKDATEKVTGNAVYVSPVIFPKWKDGAGNEYDDCLTHLDLVDHPVDHSQGPAVPILCCLRMGKNVKPFRLGNSMAGENDDLDMTDDSDMGDSTDTGETDSDTVDDAADVTPETETDTETDSANTDDAMIGELMLALADHEIILPDDTNAENFMDRLKTALIAKKGSTPGDDSNADPSGMSDFDQGDTTVASPQVAAMSAFASSSYALGLEAKLNKLLKTGRCSPAEHAEQKAKLGAVKLSLDVATGQPKPNDLSKWIASRMALPEGAVWTPRERLKRMSASKVNHPDPKTVKKDELQGKALDKAVDAFVKGK